MTWLYGDSSKSTLDINFIDFLRLAMDFSAEVLLAEEQIAAGRERRYRLESRADEELARLEALGAAVTAAAEAQAAPSESPTGRFAASITRSAASALKSELSAVKSALSHDVAKIDAEAGRERERCVKALESLLCRYDLPETKTSTQIDGTAPGPYVAKLQATTPYGLEAVLGLEIPPANPFAHDVRVDRFMEGLEVKIPEVGGWLRKQSRIVPHRLGKHRISRLTMSASEVKIELRVSADPHAAGLDLTVGGEKPVVWLSPVTKDEESKVLPFEPDADDNAKLLQLSERLAAAVAELSRSRKSLEDARLDGESLLAHPHPSTLVERLIAAMAPSVHEIARHSLSPSELVLRRLLGGDRREEVFVSKSELLQKLEAIPAPRRSLFDPLGLHEETVVAPRARTEPVVVDMVIEEKPVDALTGAPTRPMREPT